MTNRFVQCEFCHAMGDFQVMHMCPKCRRVVCKRCRGKAELRPGQCAKEKPCDGKAPERRD